MTFHKKSEKFSGNMRRGEPNLAMLSPLKKRKTSLSDACHGRPRAFTAVSSGIESVLSLQRNKMITNGK